MAAGLVLAGCGFLVDAAWLEPSSLVLTRRVVPLARAPALAGLKIAVIGDLHAGAPYIDAAKIDAIVAERAQARAARNWAESDRLRDHLAGLGVAIKDNKDGATTWEPKR